MRRIYIIVLFLLSTLFSPWIFQLPWYIALLIIIFSLLLFNLKEKYIVLFFYFLLLFFQIRTTRISSVYQFSGFDFYLHQQQLDSYPPRLARLANIVENKFETPLVYRLRQNLFNSLDFSIFFKNYFLTILFIPFIIGLIHFVKCPKRLPITLFILSILTLTFIGTNGQYGPITILPFLIYLIIS
ncbi:MAG: hypothetical protein WAV41_05000 [Microgenomates group bacterium]